uniref:Transposable element Tcb1 transposase n=1 Tax=Caenorhabditis japonica TaxID=281687 RepID=A0A8R1ICV8_CAEJA
MTIIRGRQMGLDMPTLAKQRRQNHCQDKKEKSPADKHGYQLRAEGPIWSSGVQGHCQRTSAPRFTLQKAPSEQANDSGEETFSSTEVGKGSSALGWNKVLWSDESKYLMIGTDGVTLVRRPGDKRNDPKYQVPTVKHGGGNFMMWSCFHANGVGSLIRITGTMESYMYKDILEKEMLLSGRSQMGRGWLFQQDNDPKHSSHFFKDWFAQHRPKNCTEKSEQLKEEWTKIRLQTLTDLIERCEAVIKAKGMATKY